MPVSFSQTPPLRRLLVLLENERRAVGYVLLYAMLSGIFALTLPLGVQAIIGLVSGGLLLQPAVLLITFVVIGTLCSGGLQVLQLSVVEQLQQRVFARIALDAGLRLPRVALERLAGIDLPELTNRYFEAVSLQKSLAKLLLDGVAAFLSVGLGLLLLTLYHPYFSFLGVVMLGLLYVLLRLTGRQALATALDESKHKYRIAHWLEEIARQVRLFRLVPTGRITLTRLDEEVDGYLEARQAHFRVLVRQALAMVAFKTLITGALLVMGSLLVMDRQITLGQFVASEIVIVLVLSGVEKLILSFSTVYDTLVSLDKAAVLHELPLASATGTRPLLPAPRGLAVSAEQLGYRWPGADRDALRGVSLHIGAGELVAIASPEGAGASTLVDLVAGKLPGYDGVLTLDGVSLHDLSPDALRGPVACLDARSGTFDGTLEENVRLGRPELDEAAVTAALQQAGLGEWLGRLPAGLGTPVGPGAALPPHLTRRIALARAIAGRPRLLLFDEFLRELDPAFRRDVLRVLLEGLSHWSVLAVTRDPAVLAVSHRIYLLDEGRITTEGTWPEVVAHPEFGRLLADPLPGAAA